MTTLEAITERRTRILPDGWEWKKLSDVLESFESGSRPPGGAVGVTSGVPSISAEQMTDRGIFEFDMMRYVPRDYYDEMKRGHIAPGDILIVKDGATTGKTCFVDDDFPFKEAVVNEHVFVCRPNKQLVEPRFLFYWLWSPPGQHAIRSTFQGAAVGGINQGFFDAVEVPVAPLPEQRRIAAILNEQITIVECARKAALGRHNAALALASSVLRELFGSHRDIARPHARLFEVAELLPSRSIASAGDIEVRAITTACLSEFGFVPDGIKNARMQSGHAKECLIRPGEILIARSNTEKLVGRASIYEGIPDGVVASDLTIRVRANKETIQPVFLAAYLSFLYQTGFWREKAGGASGSMKKITRSQLLELSVPVPTMTEQDGVVQQLNEKMPLARKLREATREEVEFISCIPSALMRHLFSGVR